MPRIEGDLPENTEGPFKFRAELVVHISNASEKTGIEYGGTPTAHAAIAKSMASWRPTCRRRTPRPTTDSASIDARRA